MTFLDQSEPVTSGGSTALDIMNVLDILKNQDLYQERLKELQKATKALNDGKYVGATMEQAKALMESAQAAKETQEKQIKEARDQLAVERKGFNERMQIDLGNLQRERNEVKELRAQVEQHEWQLKKEDERLQQVRQELQEFRTSVDKKAEEAREFYERYFNKMSKIQDIINS